MGTTLHSVHVLTEQEQYYKAEFTVIYASITPNTDEAVQILQVSSIAYHPYPLSHCPPPPLFIYLYGFPPSRPRHELAPRYAASVHSIRLCCLSCPLAYMSRSTPSDLQSGCPCGRVAWRKGVTQAITTCTVCDLSSLPGIDGLNVGAALPAYGTLARFGDTVR